MFTVQTSALYHLLYTIDLARKNCVISSEGNESGSSASLAQCEDVQSQLPKAESKSLYVRNVERGSLIVLAVKK